MAHATRSSNRAVRLRRDRDFAYDEESLNFLTERSTRGGDVWQQRIICGITATTDTPASPISSSDAFEGNTTVHNWPTVNILPFNISQPISNIYNAESNQICIAQGSRSREESCVLIFSHLIKSIA